MHSLWRVRNLTHPLIVLAAAVVAACAPSDASSPTSSVSQFIDSTDFDRGGRGAANAVTTASVKVTLARPLVYGAGSVSGVSAVALDVNGQPLSGKVVSWSTANTNVAKMISAKLVESVARSGKVDVIATVDGVRGVAQWTIVDSTPPKQLVATLAVSLAAPSVQLGQTTQANVTMYDGSGAVITGRAPAWSSSNPAVATVSSTGLVSAVGAGNANIVATIDGRTAQAGLLVNGVTLVPVATVNVALDSSSLIVGGTTQARATTFDATNVALTGRPIAWSSNNPAVATVSSSGVVTAVGPGIANIIATSEGKTGQAGLTVGLVPVASVQVTLNPGFVFTGQGAQATAVARDANNNILTGRLVTWSSSATGVATVASSGAVTSVAPGTANISAVIDGKQGAALLTVAKVPVSSVTVTLASASIAPAQTTQASAVTKDSTGAVLTGRAIAWTSSNTAVATVNASTGVVTAVALGTANIIATSEGKTGLAAVTVAAPTPVPVASVTVSATPTSIAVGQTAQSSVVTRDSNNNVLTGRTVVLHSGDPAIATVNAAGVVTGVTAGSVWIIANSEGKTGSTQVSVAAAAPSAPASVATVTVSLTASSITAGQNATASAVLKDSANNVLTGRTIAWSSSNPAAATVNASTGVVTAVAAGTANIIATSGGKTGQAAVTVTAVPVATVATVSASLGSPSLTVGQTTQAAAVARDASNNVMTGVAIAWSSSNTAVATVNSSGLVTAVAAGSANIVAASGGKAGQAALTVTAPAGGGGGGGSAALSGSVTENGMAIGGGTVEILSGANVVQTATVQSNGTFSVASLAAGTYDVRLQPSLAYSMGPSEPAARTVTIVSGQNVTVPFTVQKALYADNFQSYTSSSQLTSGSVAAGNFWAGLNHDIGTVSNPQSIFLDPTGGYNGDKAMRYDWPARPTAACSGAETTVGVMPRLYPPPAGTRDLWVRFTSKESPNFEHGRTGCGGRSYKFFLIGVESGGKMGRFGTYLFDGAQPTPTSTRMYMDFNDNAGSAQAQGGLQMGGDVSWGGGYHTWVLEMRGMGTANATFRVYKDGQVIGTLNGSFLNGQTLGPGWAITFEMGANINNGPDHAQSRWWREFGVYTSRPSLIP